MSRIKIILFLILILFSLIISCGTRKSSINTGAISGVVKDKTNNLIENAQVIVDNKVTNTNKDGQFYIDGIPAGEYEIYVSAAGFRTYSNTVIIYPGKTSVIEIVLELQSDLPELPGAEGSCYGSYLYDQPPIIYSVDRFPSIPTATDEVSITAKIANDIEKTDEITLKARVVYSIDNGITWRIIEMKQDNLDKTIWHAKIPRQLHGTKVIYYLQAIDTAGSLTTEIPLLSNEIELADRKFTLPVEDEDCDISVCPDGVDILKFSIGVNESELFGKIGYQNELDEGSIKPTRIITYGIGIFNLDLEEDMIKGKAILYCPLAPFVWNLPMGFVIDESFSKTSQPIALEGEGVEIKVINSILYWKINRNILGDNPNGILKLITATGATITTDLKSSLSNFLIYDASPFIRAYLRNHTYEVK